MPKLTRLASVVALFLSRPNQPISGQELMRAGGYGGWRTRVSDCRLKLGMDIPTPVAVHHDWGTDTFYTYIPPEPAQLALFEESRSCGTGF